MEWNSLTKTALEPVFERWAVERWGYQLADGSMTLSHFIWADHLWILAGSNVQAPAMAAEATTVVQAVGLTWEPSSLQIVPGPHNMVIRPPSGAGGYLTDVLLSSSRSLWGVNHDTLAWGDVCMYAALVRAVNAIDLGGFG